MNNIATRARTALNLEQYDQLNRPECVGSIDLVAPEQRQYVLRMLIKKPFGEFEIPAELKWVSGAVNAAYAYQQACKIEQPFCYLTIRSGLVESVTDDEWHVDGFSMNITHLPEQNYCWTNCCPTEYVEKAIAFPPDFDSKKHNIHLFFDDALGNDDEIKTVKTGHLYALDPYVIHRRPSVPNGTVRTFIRVSFTPIEINDVNNTENPLLPTNYDRDGLKDFRQNLLRYKIK